MSNIKLITNQLGDELNQQILEASSICILTAFTMKSGVDYLKEALESAAKRGADIKVCTGDYLYITQPDALKSLLEIDDSIEIRLWNSNGISFHPKAYLFQNTYSDCLFVGSSNLSKSALYNGIEWNLSIKDEEEVFNEAQAEFLQLFYHKNTVPLNAITIQNYESKYDKFHEANPNLIKTFSKNDERDLMLPTIGDKYYSPADKGASAVLETNLSDFAEIVPRQAQLEALSELEKTIDEQYDKALVVMATGLGKTFLAGFFAEDFKRVLFIAHRQEILSQAKKPFGKIMPNKTRGIFDGNRKDANRDHVFASIFTLSMTKHLQTFAKDEFDLIIIDEFHHAAANTYQRVLNYFEPQFLLGITATPDRNDNKDVYAICDGNVAYRINFLEAIQKNWLAPFKYYGVYDEIDYSKITWLGNRYAEEELLHEQVRDELVDKILQQWLDKRQTRTLGFCSSIKQADYLANYFQEKGYVALSLHSKQVAINRTEAIKLLENKEIEIIFTVDLFNEGVDIPSVDTLLFTRPTESLTIYTQQIGRGLRLADNKSHCVIIDLIGNYRNADLKLSLFDTSQVERVNETDIKVPEACEINLDLEVINLLKVMKKKRQPRKESLAENYYKVKESLGRRPTYVELHLLGSKNIREYVQEFNSYYLFLEWIDELTTVEQSIVLDYSDWLIEVEKTPMAKSYKMIVLLAMLERGVNRWHESISSKEVAPFFYDYLMSKEYRKRIDFSDQSSQRLWDYNEVRVARLIERMPMTKWSGSSQGLISFSEGLFKLAFDVSKENAEILYEMTKDICLFRLHYHFERRQSKLN